MLVVGEQDSGQWERHHQADDASDVAPNGEGKQHHGRRESHNLSHNARGENGVLQHLHHHVNQEYECHKSPKGTSCVGHFEQRQQGSRQDAQHLNVRDKAQHSHEDAHSHWHRETDEPKADAKHHPVAECHQHLSAEITAHIVGHIIGEFF